MPDRFPDVVRHQPAQSGEIRQKAAQAQDNGVVVNYGEWNETSLHMRGGREAQGERPKDP